MKYMKNMKFVIIIVIFFLCLLCFCGEILWMVCFCGEIWLKLSIMSFGNVVGLRLFGFFVCGVMILLWVWLGCCYCCWRSCFLWCRLCFIFGWSGIFFVFVFGIWWFRGWCGFGVVGSFICWWRLSNIWLCWGGFLVLLGWSVFRNIFWIILVSCWNGWLLRLWCGSWVFFCCVVWRLRILILVVILIWWYFLRVGCWCWKWNFFCLSIFICWRCRCLLVGFLLWGFVVLFLWRIFIWGWRISWCCWWRRFWFCSLGCWLCLIGWRGRFLFGVGDWLCLILSLIWCIICSGFFVFFCVSLCCFVVEFR